MGRGRGKGKKQSVIASRDDARSDEDEKTPSRRRGRPQKPFKDETEEVDKIEKIEEDEENRQDSKASLLNTSTKDETEEVDKIEKIEEDEENRQDSKASLLNTSTKNQAAAENGRKRIRPSQVKENVDLVQEENGVGIKANASELIIKSVGFRPNRSRRKNKPRRAAEVGVECK